MFLSRSTEKQAGHDLYWFIIDLLLIDSKNLAELILCIFFSCISWNMIFFAYLTCIYFRKYRLKKVLRIFKFVKSTKIREKNIHTKISTINVDIRTPIRWHHQKLRIIKNKIKPHGTGNNLNSQNTWNKGFCFLSRGFLIL